MTEPAHNLDVLALAAGLGTRLRPLTAAIPKALLPIYGIPLLEVHLQRLLAAAGRRVVVNAHHLADQVAAHLSGHAMGERLVLSREAEILGTGGALCHAQALLRSDPFAVINSDTLFAAPLEEAARLHQTGGYLITLIVCRSPLRPNILLAGQRVTALLRTGSDPDGFTYTGSQIVSRAVLERIPAGCFHDIRETYQELIAVGALGAYVARETSPLLDVGTPTGYLEAHRLCAGPAAAAFGLPPPAPDLRRAEAYGYVARHAQIAEGARILASVVLDGARVAPGIRVEHSIVGPGVIVKQAARGELITRAGRAVIDEPK